MLKTIILLPILAVLALSIVIDFDAEFRDEQLAFGSGKKALILMHPSWIDHFQQDLTYAFATGLGEDNWQVTRVTTQSTHDYDYNAYDLIVIGTNTHYFAPDLPTRRLLKKANFKNKPVVGIVAGIGATGRAETRLFDAIVAANGQAIAIRAFWTLQHNPGSKTSTGSNRQDALLIAHDFGREIAAKLH